MATIALYASRINQMPGLMKETKKSVVDYRKKLTALKKKTLQINPAICDLSGVVQTISASTRIQEEKETSLNELERKTAQFVEDAVRTDHEVAEEIRRRKNEFYRQYRYLQPDAEKRDWQKLCDACKKVGDYCKDHWKSLIKIAAAVVVIVALGVATALTGGLLGVILAGAFWGALSGGLIGGVIGGISAMAGGGSFLDGFADAALSGTLTGAATGAAFAGLGAAGAIFGKGIKCMSHLGKAIKATAKVTKILSLGFDGYDTMAMCVGFFDPSNPLVQLNNQMHASVLYNGLQVVVNGVAVFTGAASGTMKCFVAGTLILTLSGLAAIETIRPGDMVEATDIRTMERKPKKVLETYVRETNELVVLTVGGENLRTTPNHPFYVKGKGFLGAGELTIGDSLLDAEGQILLVEGTEREQLEEPVKVYNFQVEDFHTYHVGECGVLVHNANCGNESGSKSISQADRIKIDAWDYTPDDELYLKYKDVFDNPKYYNQETGAINWPENNGFADIPMDEVLQPGARIDRYGSDYGSFTSPEGTPYEMRAVAPGTDQRPYSVFEVVEPINVKSGSIASWFDEPGGGIQYLLPDTVDELLDAGILRRIQ